MDSSKSSGRSNGSDFLADINRSKSAHRMTYGDGFRLGIGIITAQLLIMLLVGGLAWALVVAFKLHI
ncbi:MAG: hypothetical protein NVSMB39_3100 [Candidatus Saccharimonadales bacterium]